MASTSSSILDTLPTELVDLIFKHLRAPDLVAFLWHKYTRMSALEATWRDVAQTYEELSYTDASFPVHAAAQLRKPTRLAATVCRLPTLALHIRELTLAIPNARLEVVEETGRLAVELPLLWNTQLIQDLLGRLTRLTKLRCFNLSVARKHLHVAYGV